MMPCDGGVLSLEEFAKLQIPALRHDAAQVERWRRRPTDVDVRAIAERLLRLHQTIVDQDWITRSMPVVQGLEVLAKGLAENRPDAQIVLLTGLLISRTREMLGDDPGPEPSGGLLAAEMAIGVKKRV
jgi:hypothetical protein